MNKTLLLIFLFMLTPLTAGCGTFTSPEIRGNVIDADTGKPLAGANVKAVWKTGRAAMAGLVDVKNAHVYKTQTDGNGEFVLPSIKGKKKWWFGTYEGVFIVTYKLGYKAAYIEALGGRGRGGASDRRSPNFALSPLKTEKDYYEGYYNAPWDLVAYEHQFEIEYLYDYIAKYPQSKERAGLYIKIAYHLEELKEYEKAKNIYETMIELFPRSKKFATEEIQQLRKKGVIK